MRFPLLMLNALSIHVYSHISAQAFSAKKWTYLNCTVRIQSKQPRSTDSLLVFGMLLLVKLGLFGRLALYSSNSRQGFLCQVSTSTNVAMVPTIVLVLVGAS